VESKKRKMTAEQIFVSHFPKAKIEHQRGQAGGGYFLVRKRRDEHMWSGCGNTKAQAWRDACERIGLTRAYDGLCPRGRHGLDYAGQPCDMCKDGARVY